MSADSKFTSRRAKQLLSPPRPSKDTQTPFPTARFRTARRLARRESFIELHKGTGRKKRMVVFRCYRDDLLFEGFDFPCLRGFEMDNDQESDSEEVSSAVERGFRRLQMELDEKGKESGMQSDGVS